MLMQPEPDLTGFARSYFRIWNAKSGAYRSATVSVINTDDMDELAKAIRGIRPTAANVNLSSLQHFDRYPYHLFFDLSDAVEKRCRSNRKSFSMQHWIRSSNIRRPRPYLCPGRAIPFPSGAIAN